MRISVNVPDSDFDAWVERQMQAAEKAIVLRMQYIGEQVVTASRDAGRYKDRTGNLRSSIGYCIVKDGKIMKKGGFIATSAPESNGSMGSEKGKKYLKTVASQYTGIWLLLVAGMPYAAYVEAIGLDVVSTGELLMDKLVPQALRKLGLTVN